MMEFPPDQALLEEKNTLLQSCGLDEQMMFYKWESWCLQRDNKPVLNLDNFKAFAADMRTQMERQVRATLRDKPEKKTTKTKLGMNFENMLGLPAKSHDSKNSNSNHPVPPTSDAPSLTDESGRVLEALNAHIPSASTNANGKKPASTEITSSIDPRAYHYRIMFQKLQDSSEVLDDRIDLFSAIVCDHYKIADEDLANPSELTQEMVTVVGRVVVDSNTVGGRLNTNSILIETSRRLGAGARVSLKLDEVSSYSIFPGQILALKGSNPSGKTFVAKEVLPLPPLPFSVSSKEEIENFNNKANNQPISIYVASGPWSLRDDLSFTPLKALVSYLLENPIDLVILTGPFIDINHPILSTGNIPDTQVTSLEDFFKERVSPILSKISCKCILLPHINDAISNHPAWPQDTFDRHTLGLPSNFICFPNPCIFSVNEVVFGISTNDILLHTSKEELFRTPTHGNLFSRLVAHVIQQRHFYPLFPGGSLDRGNPSNIDISHLKLGELFKTVPDVLILPSDMRYFAKTVENVISINPGKATKGVGLGSFAKLTILPYPLDSSTPSSDLLHNAQSRTKVEILKL
ncbi:DNA polymerase alpha B-subunit [Schizosaccharomyces cryophilus OY26]|uniref:DNA polymerase alpha subunit B n=1 Tax=Schizosaccharomyces cryophilus (strain OY26 / ATCC MYA-4695 / CBS 11777 / NBRC 106824 / NRRL Y48691) TaxID=653667 RepID=S9X893_SCHCR|nr:DNA polymerase alpha B-subunit [Schizosaccharomyces cryophilus OY26]EPY50026.1 DNA polymerase alpha B-subunit [Schizosaccharomyces cryophilus OY26]